MLTIKVSLSDTVCSGNKKYPIIIEVARYGTRATVKTPFSVFKKNFDFFLGKIVITPNCRISEQQACDMNSYICRKVNYLHEIAAGMEKSNDRYTPDDVVRIYKERENSYHVADYVEKMICKGYIRESQTDRYNTLLIRMSEFPSGKTGLVCFDDITYKWLVDFQVYLHSLGYTEYAVNSYIRVLHRICNMARREKVYVISPDPFQYNSSNKTCHNEKPKMNFEFVSRIESFNPDNNPGMKLARDLFLFSYYANGLSFKDIAFLKKTDVAGDVILCQNGRKRKCFTINVTPEMHEIMNRYSSEGEYMFPVIKDSGIDLQDQHRMCLRRHNRQLRELFTRLNIPCSLSMNSTNNNDYSEKQIEISLSQKGKEKISMSCTLDRNIKDTALNALNKLVGGMICILFFYVFC